jgi:hypothetical protein
MISFIGKTIEAPEQVIRTPGKRISGKVVWKKDKFQIRVGKDIYDIDNWDDISECTFIYALPTNTFFTPWHRKLYIHKSENPEIVQTTLRYWGKYRHGAIIYGKLIDNIFYPSKINKDESSISGIIT